MRIAAVTPTRGDRALLVNHCRAMMGWQTQQPDWHIVVEYPPASGACDLKRRFMDGMQLAFDKGADAVMCIEDDDYYAAGYVEHMISGWDDAGRPSLYGNGSTIYYHLGHRALNHMMHSDRASMFRTLVTADVLNVRWGDMADPWIDMLLWRSPNLRGVTSEPDFASPSAIGIKGHGYGMVAGGGHDRLKYATVDHDMTWLAAHTDPYSFGFYRSLLGGA